MENSTTSTNSYSGRPFIGNNVSYHGTPSGIRQEEFQPIIDDPNSSIRNAPIIQTNYKYDIAQEAVTKEQIRNCFYNHTLNFCPNLFEDAREYIEFPEFTAQKIKSIVIANKKAIEFQKTLTATATSDDGDSDASSFIETFQDVDMPDPDII